MTDCQWFDPVCKAKEAVGATLGDAASQALQTVADGMASATGKAFGALGSLWVLTPTPKLTGSSSTSSRALPGSLVDLLGYVQWIGLAIAGLALVALAVMFVHHDRSEQARTRLGQILGGVFVISGASSIVAHLVGGAGEQASTTVAFLRGELMSFTMWAAVLGTLVAAIRLIVSNARAALDWFSGMVTLMVVSAGSAVIAQGIVAALDAASISIINDALSCDGSGSACFGTSLATIMGTATAATPGATGGAAGVLILVIFLALIALVTSFIQMMLMLIRGGMLVALVGGMPLAAAAALAGEHGKQWWQRYLAWFLAFATYKPVAAIIYATGFQMVGELSTSGDSSGIISAAAGISLLAAALVALPALMRFWAPITAAVASGSGGGAGAAAAAAGGVAQGAVQIVGSGHTPQEPAGGTPVGAASSALASTLNIETGAAGGGSQVAASHAQSAGAGSAATGGAAAGGAAAAAGPVGLAVGAGLQVAGGATRAARDTANEATGGEQ